jgi:AmiR/NasT family two-component response regulator
MQYHPVVVATADPTTGNELRTLLPRSGYQLAGIARDGREVAALVTTLVPELVFLDATLPGRDGITVARQLMAIHPVPIVLLGAELPVDRLAAATLAGVMGVLGTPIQAETLGPTLALARARFADLRALQQEVHRLQDALALRKQVERAKGILAQRLRLSEAAAHATLQRQAQREGGTLAEAAAQVIAADRFFAAYEALGTHP